MQYNIKRLSGFTLGATDGEIGKVEEFYFDDETWTVRYLVVKTGGWLSGRKVLIAPAALQQPDWHNEILPVNLTKSQIESSPEIDTEKTVSRQQEIELYDHYSWPYYDAGGTGFYGGIGMTGMIDSRIPLEDIIKKQHPKRESNDQHLRSTAEVSGYDIHASDGEIGEVDDFIIDSDNWGLRFLIVDTGNWFPGKKVVLPTEWITGIKWEESSIHLEIPVDAVKNSPEYNPSVPVEGGYKDELYAYYGRPLKDNN